MWPQIQSIMDKKDKVWVNSMEWFYKYWGCYQLSERSFFIGKYQFPVCARCTGIIIGGLLSFIFSYFIDFSYIILIFCLPLVIDGGIQLKTSYESTNFKRFLTGFMYGFSIIAGIFHTIRIAVSFFHDV